MDYKLKYNFWKNLLAAPFIWIIIVPLVILDIFFEVYHQICFRLYHIKLNKRSAYIKIDYYALPYLKWWEKIGCIYCGYANGLLLYCAKIAADTEKYWCGIKHQETPGFIPQAHQKDYAEFGDREAYEKKEAHYRELQKKKKKHK